MAGLARMTTTLSDTPDRGRHEWIRLATEAFKAELIRLEERGLLDWDEHLFDPATAGRLAAEWVIVTYGSLKSGEQP
jgi:hypothetical protein